MDIGSDDSILGVEILDISKKLNVSKSNIQHPANMKIELKISEKIIEIKLTFAVIKRNSTIEKIASAISANDFNLPAGTQIRAVSA